MHKIDMWLDEKTLKHLKSISKKLASPGRLSLSLEEVLAVEKIQQESYFPSYILKRFLPNGLAPEPLPFRKIR